MRSFGKLLLATAKQFYRDRVALFFSFGFPLIFILIFGLVFGHETISTYKVGVAIQGDSPEARAIAQAFDRVGASEERRLLEIEHGDLGTELDRLRDGDIKAVIAIPADVHLKMAQRENAPLRIYYDPTQTAVSQIVLPVLQQVVGQMNAEMTQAPVLLSLESHSIQSHNLRSIDYLVPGIAAMSVLQMGLFGCLPLIQQRQKGILRRLKATPLRRSTMVLSQILFRLVISVLQTAVIIMVGRALFDVQMLGSWALLAGIVVLGALAFVSMGYLIASFVRTEEGAIPVVQLIFLPMMFLSGIFFPVDIMPGFMKPIVSAMPLTYFGDAMRQIMVKATPLHSLSTDSYVLVAWLAVCVVLAVRFFRWE